MTSGSPNAGQPVKTEARSIVTKIEYSPLIHHLIKTIKKLNVVTPHIKANTSFCYSRRSADQELQGRNADKSRDEFSSLHRLERHEHSLKSVFGALKAIQLEVILRPREISLRASTVVVW